MRVYRSARESTITTTMMCVHHQNVHDGLVQVIIMSVVLQSRASTGGRNDVKGSSDGAGRDLGRATSLGRINRMAMGSIR